MLQEQDRDKATIPSHHISPRGIHIYASHKEKPKQTRLVYSDNDISPEEKMAMMPQYAFTPVQKSIMV